ncbi:MAG: hypothetical protein ACRDPE_19680, partial [Solirubrobacterales bacterium]
FVPQTAREALLEVKRLTLLDPEPSRYVSWIDVVADQGLTRTEPYNFELSDQLADRLAEAHRLLQELLDVATSHTNDAEIIAKIPGVLSLPPDLEAMVERRMR